MELVSIWARKYSFVNSFSVKGEKKFVYFSNFFKTSDQLFFVKGTFSCESAILINKSVNKLYPESQTQEKRLSFSKGDSTLKMMYDHCSCLLRLWYTLFWHRSLGVV